MRQIWRSFTRAFWLAFHHQRGLASPTVPPTVVVPRGDRLDYLEARVLALEERIFGSWGVPN